VTNPDEIYKDATAEQLRKRQKEWAREAREKRELEKALKSAQDELARNEEIVEESLKDLTQIKLAMSRMVDVEMTHVGAKAECVRLRKQIEELQTKLALRRIER